MIQVLGDIIPFAVGVALSPFPIIAAVLVMLSPAGRAAGLAFLAGRVLGVAVIVFLVSALSDLIERSEDASPAVAVLRILVGGALVALAVWKWRGRPREAADASLPGWMGAIEGTSTAGAARLAFLLSVANPKELLLGVGAGVTIGSAGLSVGSIAVAIGVFTLIAAASVAIPVIAYLVASARMAGPLESLRGWLVHNNATVMAVLLLVIGFVLIGKGIASF